ncbi:MAG: PilW family protein [Gammaproteobacteria bacterium]|jgi:type IV pilus assembly protein PilW
MNGYNNQRGISLVEILVALVISLFLLAGIVQVYLGNKTAFKFTNALAEVQENGRYALDLMSQDLRLTSEWGCIEYDPTDTSNINNTISSAILGSYDSNFHDFTGEDDIEGTNDTGLNGSDTLTLRGGKTGQSNVKSPFEAATTAKLMIGPDSNIEAGDIILVARCGANDLLINEEADILLVTSATAAATETELDLATGKSQQYENDAMVIELQTVNYYIAAGASGEPALYRREFDAAPQELVEGVENLQVLYGVDTDGDEFPNQYQDAASVADFNDVVAVRVMLLMRSVDDNVTEDQQTYTYNGATTTAGDYRIRQVFSTTIALRNRIGSS